jgi:hypothetical protein
VIKQVCLIYALVLRNLPASNYRQNYGGSNYLLNKIKRCYFLIHKANSYIAFTNPCRKVIQKYKILHFTGHNLQAVQCIAQAMALLPTSELGVLHASCCRPGGLVAATKQNTVQWSPTSFAKIQRIPYRLLECKRVPCASTVSGLFQRTSIKNSSEKYTMSRPALRYIQPSNTTVLEI